MPRGQNDEAASEPGARVPDGALIDRPTLFEEHWWLDAATDGQWRRAEAVWDGEIVCTLPYVVNRHWGLNYIEMPKYTRLAAPRFALPAANPVRTRKNRIRALSEALAQLPRHDRFEITLPPDGDAAYPFVQLGYTATTTYTFRTEPGWEPAATLALMKKQMRYDIRAAERRLAVTHDDDIEPLIRLSNAQWGGRGDRHDYAALRRLWAACIARGCGSVVIIADDTGKPLAIAALVWDDRNLYHWLTARVADVSAHGATALAIWEAMKKAAALGRLFDADGYDSWQSAQSLARFGLTPAARPVINRGNLLWRGLFLARTAWHPSRIDRHFRC